MAYGARAGTRRARVTKGDTAMIEMWKGGTVRSLVLVLLGMGIGLSVSATSGTGGQDLAGAERVVIAEDGGAREVVLGKVDGERFGVLVRDKERKLEVFLGLRGEGKEERAECGALAGEAGSGYEALLSAWGKGSEMWVRRQRGGELLSRAGISVSEERTELVGESRGSDQECGTAMRWSSETGALELEGCEEFLWRKWHRTKRYAP